MSKKDRDALGKKFDAFSRRLDAKTKEFKQRGELSAGNKATSERLRKRMASVRQKLQSAIDKGREWEILGYEFERDLNDLAEDFERFVRRIDVVAMKPRRATRSR